MTFSPLIRRATPDDAIALAQAGRTLFLQAYSGMIPAHEMAAYVANNYNETSQVSELSNPMAATLLLESEDKIAGFAHLLKNPAPVDGVEADVELKRIYLDKEWHGTGMAQRLLNEVFAEARLLSAHAVWLAVWEENVRAISFYKKAGFEAVGSFEFRVGSLVQTDVVMRAGTGEL